MAPGGPLGPRGGKGRDMGGREGATDAPAGAGEGGALGGRDAGEGGALGGRDATEGGALGVRDAGGAEPPVGRDAGGGADAGGGVVRAGGLLERLPSDFAAEFGATLARDEAGVAGATEPVRAVRAMLVLGDERAGSATIRKRPSSMRPRQYARISAHRGARRGMQATPDEQRVERNVQAHGVVRAGNPRTIEGMVQAEQAAQGVLREHPERSAQAVGCGGGVLTPGAAEHERHPECPVGPELARTRPGRRGNRRRRPEQPAQAPGPIALEGARSERTKRSRPVAVEHRGCVGQRLFAERG